MTVKKGESRPDVCDDSGSFRDKITCMDVILYHAMWDTFAIDKEKGVSAEDMFALVVRTNGSHSVVSLRSMLIQ